MKVQLFYFFPQEVEYLGSLLLILPALSQFIFLPSWFRIVPFHMLSNALLNLFHRNYPNEVELTE